MPSQTTNANLVNQLQSEVLREGNIENLDSILHEDVHVSDIAFDGVYEGIEDYRGHVNMLRTAFDDIQISHEILSESDESVTVEYEFKGTHTGPFLEIEGTGNDISFRGIDVYQFKDGRIKSIRSAFTLFGLLSDIGVVSLPSE